MPPALRARTSAAIDRYLASCKVLQDEKILLFNRRLDAKEEAILIETLGEIWHEWTGASPQTRHFDREPQDEGVFPFAEWVKSLLPDEIAPSESRIREVLSRRKRKSHT